MATTGLWSGFNLPQLTSTKFCYLIILMTPGLGPTSPNGSHSDLLPQAVGRQVSPESQTNSCQPSSQVQSDSLLPWSHCLIYNAGIAVRFKTYKHKTFSTMLKAQQLRAPIFTLNSCPLSKARWNATKARVSGQRCRMQTGNGNLPVTWWPTRLLPTCPSQLEMSATGTCQTCLLFCL